MTDLHNISINSGTEVPLEGIDSKQGSAIIQFASLTILTTLKMRSKCRGKKNDVVAIKFSDYF